MATDLPVRDKIKLLVYRAIDEISEQLSPGEPVEKTEATILLGSRAQLDSMALVNLIVVTEGLISQEFQQEISLLGEEAFSQADSPFQTVGSFIDYIDNLLKSQGT
jgi:D-alanine--poly(phosphoribitol) ligase subunit 2